MPTKTFLNLPVAKKEKITKAARTIFANSTVDEVKIVDIVKAAEIPRGSFYQYFSDISDLFLYVFYEHWASLEAVVDALPRAKSLKELFKNSLIALYPYYMSKETNELVKKSVFYIKKDNVLWQQRTEKLRNRLRGFKQIAIEEGIKLPDKKLELLVEFLNKIKDDLMDSAYENGWSLNMVLEMYDNYISFLKI